MSILLFNNDAKSITNLNLKDPPNTPVVSHGGVDYYLVAGLPGVFLTPPNEQSLTNCLSAVLQNTSNSGIEPTESIGLYNESYQTPADYRYPENIEDYIHPKTTRLSLKEGVVGWFPDFSYNQFFHEHLAQNIEKLGLQKGRILEIGCGVGRTLLFLKKKFPDISVHGLEPAENGAQELSKAATHYGLDIQTINSSVQSALEDLPLGSFDLVFCHIVLSVSDINAPTTIEAMGKLSRQFVMIYDVMPEFWEIGTRRSLAALAYFLYKKYSYGYASELAGGKLIPQSRITARGRLNNSWNPLSEPSFILLEKS